VYRYVRLVRPAAMIDLVTDTFPRQQARTQRFTLGVPRSFQVSPDGGRVAFLRSRGGADPVTCLWVLDVASGEERLIADPAEISPGSEAGPEEKARRERSRERASGIVSFAVRRFGGRAHRDRGLGLWRGPPGAGQ
jgi:dipeptidyl-peptidase 4